MALNFSITHQVNTYIEQTFIEEDKDLSFTIKNSKKNNLPPIQINPVIGKTLYLLAKINQSKNILEIGTLGGYSTLWLAKALPEDGKILTIEHNEEYAAVAAENFKHAKMDNKIFIQYGKALTLLPVLVKENLIPFDLIFIDANKEEYPDYMEYAIKLSHPGTVIICDNVIRNGGVLESQQDKEYYKLLAKFNKKLSKDKRLESTILPTMLPLKDRDYLDGVSISIVK